MWGREAEIERGGKRDRCIEHCVQQHVIYFLDRKKQQIMKTIKLFSSSFYFFFLFFFYCVSSASSCSCSGAYSLNKTIVKS